MTDPAHNTRAAVDFLRMRPGFPVLSFAKIDRETGKKGLFETKSFPLPFNAAAIEEWIEGRQGRGNIYYLVNPAINVQDKKTERENVKELASLHVDLDPYAGEAQDEAQARIIKQLTALKQPPTWIINSGGGVQGIWDLVEAVPINGQPEAYESLKMYNVQLERDLGGDHCHNIDRIMRLPGTINCPDERKMKKGRKAALAYIVKHNKTNYKIGDFVKAAVVQDAGTVPGKATPSALGSIKLKISGNVKRIDNLDDEPSLAALKPWVKMCICFGKDEDKVYASRSEMVFAVVCEMVRAKVPDDLIVACLLDPVYAISASILEKKNVDREVHRVLTRAHEFAIDPDLSTMNAKHAIVTLGDKTKVMSFRVDEITGGLTHYFRDFENFCKFYMKYSKLITWTENGEVKTRKQPLGEWWLKNGERLQYDGIVFMPGNDSEVISRHGLTLLNLWQGFATPATRGEKHHGFLEHIRENLCNGQEDYYNYLICWLAHRIQHRDGPAGVAVVLKSESEGTGKGFFANMIGALFGKHYKHITNSDHLTGKFNAHLHDCCLLFVDEAFFAGDKRHGSILKTIITEPTLMLERKGVDVGQMRNNIGMIMASNAKFVVPAGQDARRFFVLNVSNRRLQDTTYFAAIAKQMNEEGGLSDLLFYLQNLDLTGFNIRNVPKTEALEEQKSMTRSGIDALVEQLANDGQVPCMHHGKPHVSITSGDKTGDGLWAWARANYRELTMQAPSAMMGTLKRDWGCKHYRSNGVNGVEFPPLAELRALFDKKHGKQVWTGSSHWSMRTGDKAAADTANIPF